MSDDPVALAEQVVRHDRIGHRGDMTPGNLFLLADALLASEAARQVAEEKLREWKWEVERRDDIINSETSLRREAESLVQSLQAQIANKDRDWGRLAAAHLERAENAEARCERMRNLFKETRIAHYSQQCARGEIPAAQVAILADMDTRQFEALAAAKEAPTDGT